MDDGFFTKIRFVKVSTVINCCTTFLLVVTYFCQVSQKNDLFYCISTFLDSAMLFVTLNMGSDRNMEVPARFRFLEPENGCFEMLVCVFTF